MVARPHTKGIHTMSAHCPCNSGKTYPDCCEPFHLAQRPAPTAEALMRARYSAYAMKLVDFLFNTCGEAVRKEFDHDGTKTWADKSAWNGLEILRTEAGLAGDAEGTVEFVAHYASNGVHFKHHEIAHFAKNEEGYWIFMDGEIQKSPPIRRESPKINRNDPCPCGSGKKFKKCCEAKLTIKN